MDRDMLPPSTKIPQTHREFLEHALPALQKDERLIGVAAGGSLLLGSMDEFSDLDLVIVVETADFDSVMSDRRRIAGEMGDLLEAFTGEHVGESRLLICLFQPHLLHVDLKFVSFADIAQKVENPVVLWERDSRLSDSLYREIPEFPMPPAQWIEERFWIWIHYAATKIGRGELFETLDFLSFLRNSVLGPLILNANGARPQGVRKLETAATPEQLDRLKATIAQHDTFSCIAAVFQAIELYRQLRSDSQQPSAAEGPVLEYLRRIATEKGYRPSV